MTLTLLLACSSPPPPPPPAPLDPWAGSASCAPCHATEHAAWVGSHHALAERPAAAVRGAWPQEKVPVPDGPDRPFERVIGVDPLWQPLIPVDRRTQVSSRAWDTAKGAWFDVFSDARAPGDWGHWTGRGMTWERQCAACHVSEPVVQAARDGSYDARWRELGVACEACHGPSAAHAQSPTTPTPGPRDRDAIEATCAGCHTRGGLLSDHPVPGAPLLDHVAPTLPGLDDTFGPDGTVVAEDFEGTAFGLSRMHAAGVRCADCHEPHSSAPLRPGDALCTSCHAALPGDHAHHAPGAPGSACVDCHMPTTTYMQVDVRHDHRFARPDPALARELGARVACDRCHTVDDALVARAEAWWTWDEPTRDRTRAIAAARAGRPDAPDRLRAALGAEADPAWRAVLLGATAPWADRFEGDLLRAASDADAQVRVAAVQALAPAPAPRPSIEALLRDPIAAVRLAAARSLEPHVGPDDPRMAEHRAWLDARVDQPEYAAELAAWWAATGRIDQSLSLLERAVTLDPRNAGWLRDLAVARAAFGDPAGAQDALDRALALTPDDPDLHFLRGLGLAGRGDAAAARVALGRALELDPRHARAAYNLGLLDAAAGNLAAAERRLTLAVEADPTRSDAAFALATVRDRRGDRAGTVAALEETLRRDPNHPDAAAMLAALQRR